MGKQLTDRDLTTAVTEQANVIHKDYGSGIIRRIEIAADSLLIEFQDADGYYHENADSADEFEWAEGFEDYGEKERPVAIRFANAPDLEDRLDTITTELNLYAFGKDETGERYPEWEEIGMAFHALERAAERLRALRVSENGTAGGRNI